MVDEDSHSTDLSVKIAKKGLEILLLLYNLHISVSDQIKDESNFLFFFASNFRYKTQLLSFIEQLLSNNLRNCGQLVRKSRATYGKPLCDLS